MKTFLSRGIAGWLVWVVIIGILYWLGVAQYHRSHTGTFIIILAVLLLVLIGAITWLARKQRTA